MLRLGVPRISIRWLRYGGNRADCLLTTTSFATAQGGPTPSSDVQRQITHPLATRQEESGSRILVATRMQRAVGQAGRITRVIAAAICSHRERSSASRLRPV